MNLYLQATAVWGVYLAAVVFFGGMAWRLWQWSTTPRSPIRLGLFPKPATRAGRFGKLMKDTFIAPQSARITPWMYAFAMTFHLAALAAFFGHLRLVHEFDPLVALVGQEGMNALGAFAGGAAGILMLVAVLFWIARRTLSDWKVLSVPSDYLILVLLLGIVIMGDHLRFVGHLHAPTYIAWFQSLLLFRPQIPNEIAASNVAWSLGTHMLFVDLFLIYFPFSKMVHTLGTFSLNLVRSE